MKNRIVFVLLILAVFASGCVSPPPQMSEQPYTTEEQNATQPSIPPVESAQQAERAREEDTVAYIQPELVYTGVYNGPLFDTSAQVGEEAPTDLFIGDMKRNGVSFVLMFFAVDAEDDLDFQPGSGNGIDYMDSMLGKYPDRIVPFFQKGAGAEETSPGAKLAKEYEESLLKIDQWFGRRVVRGLGELEQYAWDVAPDDPEMLALFDAANRNGLFVMFHPLSDQTANVEKVLVKYPETTFIIHQFPEDFSKDRERWLGLMDKYKNFYFGIEADHMMYDGNVGLLYKYENYDYTSGKQNFVSDFDKNSATIMQSAINRYKTPIEAQPDRFFWGTEIGRRYAYEPDVYDRTIKFSREFIAQLMPDVQEKFAHKNAERVLLTP